VPRLWTETIDEHRRAVRDAAIDATAALVAEHGLSGVSMSRIAEQTGIGRATLYKYFPDVDALLLAWHERQIARHLQQLTQVRDRAANQPTATAHTVLRAVLDAYATIQYDHHRARAAGPHTELVHHGPHVEHARRQLLDLLTDLLAETARAGHVRDDVPPNELATYCLHALTAATDLPSVAAVRRLVGTVLAGLRPA
jgi:AcrR family transcriptional regulator